MPDLSEFLAAAGVGLQHGGQAGFGAAQFQEQQRRQNLSDMLGILDRQRTQQFREGQAGREEERLDLARRAQVFRQFESDITGARKAMEPGKQLTKPQLDALILQERFKTDPQFQQDYVNAMLSKLTKSGQPTAKRDVTTTIPLGQARSQALKDFETKQEDILLDFAAQGGLDVKELGIANVERNLRAQTDPLRTVEPGFFKDLFGAEARTEPNPFFPLLQQLQYYDPTNIPAVDSAIGAIQGIAPQPGLNPADTLPALPLTTPRAPVPPTPRRKVRPVSRGPAGERQQPRGRVLKGGTASETATQIVATLKKQTGKISVKKLKALNQGQNVDAIIKEVDRIMGNTDWRTK